MSGYTDLRDLGVRFVAPDGPMPPAMNRWPLFRASWTQTIETLANELRHLDAQGIAIELDMEERMFRLDGLPRSDARARTDAVRISFTSKWGPLRYETAEFTGRWGEEGWQQNVRAIALSMEALRKVDRYGVSKRGEQYRGWRASAHGHRPRRLHRHGRDRSRLPRSVGGRHQARDSRDAPRHRRRPVRVSQGDPRERADRGMSYFAGIDYDTHAVHFVFIDEDDAASIIYQDFWTRGMQAFDRLRGIRDVLPSRSWWSDNVIAACIEEPFARGKLMIQNQPKLKAVQGAIVACLPSDLLLNPIAAPTWRKTVGLKGNCTKDEVREWAIHDGFFRLLGDYPQDAADAYCLARAAQILTVPAE